MTNNDVMITHAKRKGKLVSIKDVPKGEKINCICTKCGKPLGAKKGDYKDHHFYHIVKADCNGETYFHIEAKLQILPILKFKTDMLLRHLEVITLIVSIIKTIKLQVIKPLRLILEMMAD